MECAYCSTARVPPHIPVREISEAFASTDIESIAVVDQEHPIGIVTRSKFLARLSGRYAYELNFRKPVLELAHLDPLVVPEADDIETIIRKAIARPVTDIYDDVIVVDEDGRFKGMISVKELIIRQGNVLARSIMQKELANERARELEELGRVKCQFIANVTHELRSPVNVIISLAELMKLASRTGNHASLGQHVEILHKAAVSLKGVVGNILDMSKIEAGRMEVVIETFDLADIVTDVADVIRVMVGGRPVDLRTDCRGVTTMRSDPVKIRQILLNLASNAAKFTNAGEIGIGARLVDGSAVLTVRDTGIGIRESDRSRLFQSFSQLDDAHTKRHDGTGLGLTITKHLVEMLHGSIAFESTYGSGTTFIVSIPAEPPQ